MQLDTFMLADAATAVQGRLYVHGGGITRIDTPVVPVLVPPLTIVARFESTDKELEEEHRVGIVFKDPTGRPVVPELTMPIPPQLNLPPLAPGEVRYLQMALAFGPLPLEQEGLYSLEFQIDDFRRHTALPVVLT